MRFRTGRKLGRTVYIQGGELAAYDDTLIGIMDTPALGELTCIALNRLADLDPLIVETVARQVARQNRSEGSTTCRDHCDQRSVDPDDAGGAVVTVHDHH